MTKDFFINQLESIVSEFNKLIIEFELNVEIIFKLNNFLCKYILMYK